MLSIFNHFSVPSVVQFPHEVRSNIVVAALPTIGEPNEAVIAVEMDPPQPESAVQDPIPCTSSQVPITDPSSVAKPREKGRKAKRKRAIEEASTNTAPTYLNLGDQEPVSNHSSGLPAYLFNPPPSDLGIDDLRKHGVISDIEKNRAITRVCNKILVLIKPLHNILKSMDPTEKNAAPATDHASQADDAV